MQTVGILFTTLALGAFDLDTGLLFSDCSKGIVCEKAER
jgi:hypothetical protein